MRSSSLASQPNALVCPLCEVGRLRSSGRVSSRCDSCSAHFGEALVKLLNHIVGLPDATGRHACECGHPEMRRLPDGTYHCPACGSEVLPVDAPSGFSGPGEHGEAYRAGWMDGCFGELGSFDVNPNLARWEDPSDRLAYYRGHRAGTEVRQARNDLKEDTRETFIG